MYTREQLERMAHELTEYFYLKSGGRLDAEWQYYFLKNEISMSELVELYEDAGFSLLTLAPPPELVVLPLPPNMLDGD